MTTHSANTTEASSVSVIIPTYNDKERLLTALRAVCSQTYPVDRLEILVADNGSNDGTVSAVRSFSSTAVVSIALVEERDIQSSYAARNKAIRNSKGSVLAFTDSDCIPCPDWVRAGVEALHKSNCQAAGGLIEFFYEHRYPTLVETLDSGSKLAQAAYVESIGFAATANFFAYRKLFDSFGLFRTDLISGGDYEFGRRVSNAGVRIALAEQAIVRHPARSRLRDVIRKSRRIASGQKQLERLGLLEHGRIGYRRLVPAMGFLRRQDLPLSRRIALATLATGLRYLNTIWRIW